MINEAYRRQLKEKMDAYKEHNYTLDQIYEGAHYRQLKLVSIAFDAAVDAVMEKTADPDFLKDDGTPIRAQDFYPAGQDIRTLSPEDARMTCALMAGFFHTHETGLRIVDGQVKSKQRILEKAQDQPDMSVSSITDINRLTVTSEDLPLLDSFIKKFNARFPSGNAFGKDEWEMKYFGLLSKSTRAFIDGFPGEVHINEPGQVLVSKVMTHFVYEVMRTNVLSMPGAKEFDDGYHALPGRVRQSIDEHKSQLSPGDAEKLEKLYGELAEKINSGKSQTYRDKYNDLLDIHRKAHAVFMQDATPEWQMLYRTAQDTFDRNVNAHTAQFNAKPSKLPEPRP